MENSSHKEKHLDYVGMQATRDVEKLFGIGKLIAAVVFAGWVLFKGLTATSGSAAGAYPFLLIIPVMLLVSALNNFASIAASSARERSMRAGDRAGRPPSKARELILMAVIGVVVIHLIISNMFPGYLGSLLQLIQSGGKTPDGTPTPLTPLLLILSPYAGLAFMLFHRWKAPITVETDLSEHDQIKLAQSQRVKQRWQILGIYAGAAVIGAAILYFGLR